MIDSVRPEKLRAWELTATVLLIAGLVSAVGSIALLLVPLTARTVHLVAGLPVDLAYALLLVGGLVWRSWTRRIRRAIGDDEGLSRYTWAWVVSIAALVIGECVAGSQLTRSDPVFRLLVVATALRVVLILFWSGLILAIRRDLRGVLAEGPARVTPATDQIRYDTVTTTGIGPADDGFWQAAGALAVQVGAELPLLETTRSLDRRWFLVPADPSSIAELSGQLTPGAVLTLFPTPPTGTGPAKPARADEYYGLLQAAPGGPVRFQLVLPSRVTDFQAAARGAHRAGLYLPNDPAARTAITPAAEERV